MYKVVVKKLTGFEVVEHTETAETMLEAKRIGQDLTDGTDCNVISDALIYSRETGMLAHTVQNLHKD